MKLWKKEERGKTETIEGKASTIPSWKRGGEIFPHYGTENPLGKLLAHQGLKRRNTNANLRMIRHSTKQVSDRKEKGKNIISGGASFFQRTKRQHPRTLRGGVPLRLSKGRDYFNTYEAPSFYNV